MSTRESVAQEALETPTANREETNLVEVAGACEEGLPWSESVGRCESLTQNIGFARSKNIKHFVDFNAVVE